MSIICGLGVKEYINIVLNIQKLFWKELEILSLEKRNILISFMKFINVMTK